MRLRRLPEAIHDVDAIWLYIAERDPAAADILVARLAQATERLIAYPHSGSPRPELHPEVRSIPVAPYIIFYRVGAATIDIIRVLHGARDLFAHNLT